MPTLVRRIQTNSGEFVKNSVKFVKDSVKFVKDSGEFVCGIRLGGRR